MRATISFDIDLDQVEGTMGTLVAQEAPNLRATASLLEDCTGPPRMKVLEDVTEALRLLQETSIQLQQYRDMLLSFERARFETMLPQPADPDEGSELDMSRIQNTLGQVEKFDGFLEDINSHQEGVSDDLEFKEG